MVTIAGEKKTKKGQTANHARRRRVKERRMKVKRIASVTIGGAFFVARGTTIE